MGIIWGISAGLIALYLIDKLNKDK